MKTSKELTEEEKAKAMEEMDCWLVDNHLKKCAEHKKQ